VLHQVIQTEHQLCLAEVGAPHYKFHDSWSAL
jgi:hypothetical protein